MASGPHTFVTMAVFTAEKFHGNPLAIVCVRGHALSQQRKALIAKEFRYSETAFVHDAPGPGQPRQVEIFTEGGKELPFAGYPIIGVAHYIFQFIEKLPYTGPADRDTQRQSAVFQTKAGPIPVFYNPYRQVAACAVPTKYHVHERRVTLDQIVATQPHVQIVPTFEKEKGRTFPLVSIVQGVSFVLVDLTDNPELFAALQAAKSPEVELDPEWAPSSTGCMYYKVVDKSEQAGEPTIHNVHARMMSRGVEDPGTGSACAALACYLALQSPRPTAAAGSAAAEDDMTKTVAELKLEPKTERVVFGIQQGVEMGRTCMIAVEVDIHTDGKGNNSITNVILSGRAMLQTQGFLIGS